MSILIMSRIFAMNLGGSNRKLVALRLADFAQDDGRGIWPSVGRLAAETEISERTVQRILGDFVAEGILVLRQKASGRPGETNRYDFDLDKLYGYKPDKATGDSVSPVATGDRRAETGDTGDRDGCHGDTRTIMEPPIEPSTGESARASASTGDYVSLAAIQRSFKRWYPTWPTYVGDSEPEAWKAWQALTEEDRILAAERTPAYLEAVRAAGRTKVCSAAVYLRERRWLKVPASQPMAELRAPPFGKGWMARRLALLARPCGPLPRLSAFNQARFDAADEAGREAIFAAHRAANGWTSVRLMHERAAQGHPAIVSAGDVDAGRDFQPVRVGSALWEAWAAVHAERGLPWLPDPGRQEWVYFPAVDASAGDLRQVVRDVLDAFLKASGVDDAA